MTQTDAFLSRFTAGAWEIAAAKSAFFVSGFAFTTWVMFIPSLKQRLSVEADVLFPSRRTCWGCCCSASARAPAFSCPSRAFSPAISHAARSSAPRRSSPRQTCSSFLRRLRGNARRGHQSERRRRGTGVEEAHHERHARLLQRGLLRRGGTLLASREDRGALRPVDRRRARGDHSFPARPFLPALPLLSRGRQPEERRRAEGRGHSPRYHGVHQLPLGRGRRHGVHQLPLGRGRHGLGRRAPLRG